MELSKDLEMLMDELVCIDLIEQPEGYEKAKEEAFDKLEEALEILKNLGF